MEKIGLIPCAGRGSRLSLPFSKELYPNVHLESYEPVIMHSIYALKKVGVINIVVTINPQKMDLLKYLQNGNQWGVNISYCVHPEPISLPHSIDEAYHLTKEKLVFFSMPDTVVHPTDYLITLLKSHEKNKESEITLAGFMTDKPSKFGMVDFSEETGQVTEIIDKPSKTHLKWMWGGMIWNPRFTEEIHNFIINNKVTQTELLLSDALKPLILKNEVNIHCFDNGKYRDLGTFDEIREWYKEFDTES